MEEKTLLFSEPCQYTSFRFNDDKSCFFLLKGANESYTFEKGVEISCISMSFTNNHYPRFLYDLPYLQKSKKYSNYLYFTRNPFSTFTIKKDGKEFYVIATVPIEQISNISLPSVDFDVISFFNDNYRTLGFVISEKYREMQGYLEDFFKNSLPSLYIEGQSIYLTHIDNSEE